MIKRLIHKIRRFSREEDANAGVEFALMFPIFFIILISSIELGIMTLRYTFLERSLDLAVRQVRLTTGAAPTHGELKETICEGVPMLENCSQNLLLEMVQINPRNWSDPSLEASCTDQSLEVQPVTTFESGAENELVILRACAKYTPRFPNIGFGHEMIKDEAGDVSMVVAAAFVQEPM